MKRYLFNLGIAFDQGVNTMLGGSPDETLSARAHRQRVKGQRFWGWTANAIDGLFFWQRAHCHESYLAEVQRRQTHPTYAQAYEARKL